MRWLKEGETFDTMKGGLSIVDAVFLRALSESVARDGMQGFDTGCFTGWTSWCVWPTFKEHNGHFYCVDWFRGGPGSVIGDFWWDKETAMKMSPLGENAEIYPSDRVLLQLLKNIEAGGGLDHVSVIVSESWRIAEIVADKSIDYVYIGGDHRYSGVVRDLKAWIPKVRDGGVICGHAWDWDITPEKEPDLWDQLCREPEQDFYPHGSCHFGVNRALNELVTKGLGQVIATAGNCWATRMGEPVFKDTSFERQFVFETNHLSQTVTLRGEAR